MTMWIVIMWAVIALVIAALAYLGIKVPALLNAESIKNISKFEQFSIGLLLTLGVTGILAVCIDFINAVVCVLYLAMIWAVSDLAFWLLEKFANVHFAHNYIGWIALSVTIVALVIGWHLDHKVWQTDYELTTSKNVPNLKVAMFADSHLGTTFDANGFAEHLKKIQAENPDIVVIVGDYVDDGTSKEEMIKATRILGQMQTKYGVYFVAGNHDKGYYGAQYRGFSEQELLDELQKNGIKVLRDESVLLADAFYIIGRRDFSVVKEQGGYRSSMSELTKDLDKSKYMIVLDHQPTDFTNQAKSEVDLVLCGHTHGGQLFPFNQVGKWIKANDLVYGYEKRAKTDFIVTSGISDWAIKFKTGTKSEFVIINLQNKR